MGYTVEDNYVNVSVSNFVGDPDTGGSGFGGVAVDSALKPGEVATDAGAMAKEIERALLDFQRVATGAPKASL